MREYGIDERDGRHSLRMEPLSPQQALEQPKNILYVFDLCEL